MLAYTVHLRKKLLEVIVSENVLMLSPCYKSEQISDKKTCIEGRLIITIALCISMTTTVSLALMHTTVILHDVCVLHGTRNS